MYSRFALVTIFYVTDDELSVHRGKHFCIYRVNRIKVRVKSVMQLIKDATPLSLREEIFLPLRMAASMFSLECFRIKFHIESSLSTHL